MNSNQDPKWLKDIPVNLIIELGKSTKTVDEILMWRKGTTIKLEDSTKKHLKVYLNDLYFAYGDVLKNEDGEMSLRFEKIMLNDRSLDNVSKSTNL